MTKTFLISPVRGQSPDVWQAHVAALEAEGYEVHWPHRDTDQSDIVGLRICADNMKAIAAADVVHVIWDGQSQGCLFDLGIAFALGKKVVPIQLPEQTKGKSFQNVIRAWSEI
jgi:nucleoside 2-deoxyribosyltransferase